jgi:hypothetical protein
MPPRRRETRQSLVILFRFIDGSIAGETEPLSPCMWPIY